MTREDVKKAVDALKKRGMGVIDLENPVYTTVAAETGMKDISLNIWNPPEVVAAICGELDIE